MNFLRMLELMLLIEDKNLNKNSTLNEENIGNVVKNNKANLKQELYKKYKGKTGITPKRIDFMVEMFGEKYSKEMNPDMIINILKNPDRFMTKMIEWFAKNPTKLQNFHKIYKNNFFDEDDPFLDELYDEIGKAKDEVERLEDENEELINRNLGQDKKIKDLEQKLEAVNRQLNDFFEKKYETGSPEVKAGIKKIKDFKEREADFKKTVFNKNLTHKRVGFLRNGEIVDGKVILDPKFAKEEDLMKFRNTLYKLLKIKQEVNEEENIEDLRDEFIEYVVVDEDGNTTLEYRDSIISTDTEEAINRLREEDEDFDQILETDEFEKFIFSREVLEKPKIFNLLKTFYKKKSDVEDKLADLGFSRASQVVGGVDQEENSKNSTKRIIKVENINDPFVNVLYALSNEKIGIVYSGDQPKPGGIFSFNIKEEQVDGSMITYSTPSFSIKLSKSNPKSSNISVLILKKPDPHLIREIENVARGRLYIEPISNETTKKLSYKIYRKPNIRNN